MQISEEKEKYTRKLKDIPWLLIGRINIVKITVLPNSVLSKLKSLTHFFLQK